MKQLILVLLLGASMNVLSATPQKVWKGSAILVIKKAKIDLFKKAVHKIIVPTLKEAGCISYEGYQQLDENGQETNKFVFHEIWKSQEAMLIDHKEKSQHMKDFFQEIKADTPDSFLESFEAGGSYVTILH